MFLLTTSWLGEMMHDLRSARFGFLDFVSIYRVTRWMPPVILS